MTEDYTSHYMDILPTEILLKIFTLLHARRLITCRRVCPRWKQIIDDLASNDALWLQYCKQDYTHLYKSARMKTRRDLTWFNLYRSLTLWPRLASAREIQDEFASAPTMNEEIKGFKILPNGIIGVHKQNSIVYYEMDTFEQAQRDRIPGHYLRYMENEHTIAALGYHLQLIIIRKGAGNPHYDTDTTFENVKTFLLVDSDVYYVTLNDDIKVCHLIDPNLYSSLIKRVEDGVMSLGYSDDHLNVLTFQKNIYAVFNRDFNLVCSLDVNTNLLHQLHKYNFLECLDWRIYFQWMYVLNHSIPEGPLRDTVTVRTYGDVVFVGSNWGVLRVYYAPYSSGEFDIYHAEPVKQYNFMERYDCPVLSMCPILQVDVIESEDGHTVVVAMPKKIALVNFNHNV